MDGEVTVVEVNKPKIVLLLLASVACVATGISMIRHGEQVIGWIGTLFFSLGIPATAYMLFPGVGDLKIDKHGIQMRSLFRPVNLTWDDVVQFYVGHIRTGYSSMKVIGIEYSDTYQNHRIGRQLSNALTGMQDGLPNTFNLPLEEVCELLNQAKKDWG